MAFSNQYKAEFFKTESLFKNYLHHG